MIIKCPLCLKPTEKDPRTPWCDSCHTFLHKNLDKEVNCTVCEKNLLNPYVWHGLYTWSAINSYFQKEKIRLSSGKSYCANCFKKTFQVRILEDSDFLLLVDL